MKPTRFTLRKDLERRRANLPARPIPAPLAAPAKPPAEMSFRRWLGILAGLAVLGWCAGWAVSWLSNPDEVKITSLDNLPKVPKSGGRLSFGIEDAADQTTNAEPDATGLAAKAFLNGPYRLGELIFRARSPEELSALLQRVQQAGGTLLGSIGRLNAVRVSFPSAQNMSRFLQGNPGDEEVPNVELNAIVTLPEAPAAPTDPYAPGSLQPFGGSALEYMGVPQNNASWGNGVVVAMLDTGLSQGTTNILKGGTVNQLDLTDTGTAPEPGGHGDMVASLLAGASGEQGIVPAASILSVRVLDDNDQGDVFGVTDGIYTAIAEGAKVLNLSLGTDQSSDLLQQAINYAIAQGAVVVAAAGNSGDGQILYPAAYPGVVAVGSVDATGTRATFSDYGPEMDLTAPGVGIATVTTAGNETFSGTSSSSPLVAGAIASLLASNPGLTGPQAVDLLTTHADYAGPVTTTGTNEFYGAGVVDLTRVLDRNNAALSDVALADMYLNVTSMPTTPTAPLEVSVQNRGNTELGAVQVTVDVDGQITTQTMNGLQPNEVRAVTVQLPVAQLLQPGGVGVTATAQTGQFEANTANNTKSRVFHLVPASGN